MKKITLANVSDYSWCEACKAGPFGKGDVPCVVRSRNEVQNWVSRKAAIKFYQKGALDCDGCEAERYGQIADFLAAGCTDVTDGDEWTEQMNDIMKKLGFAA